jgi:hypothetical protein
VEEKKNIVIDSVRVSFPYGNDCSATGALFVSEFDKHLKLMNALCPSSYVAAAVFYKSVRYLDG